MNSQSALPYVVKSDAELATLTPKNLKAYFKAERLRFFRYFGNVAEELDKVHFERLVQNLYRSKDLVLDGLCNSLYGSIERHSILLQKFNHYFGWLSYIGKLSSMLSTHGHIETSSKKSSRKNKKV